MCQKLYIFAPMGTKPHDLYWKKLYLCILFSPLWPLGRKYFGNPKFLPAPRPISPSHQGFIRWGWMRLVIQFNKNVWNTWKFIFSSKLYSPQRIFSINAAFSLEKNGQGTGDRLLACTLGTPLAGLGRQVRRTCGR